MNFLEESQETSSIWMKLTEDLFGKAKVLSKIWKGLASFRDKGGENVGILGLEINTLT
jgi:hypothetical protein